MLAPTQHGKGIQILITNSHLFIIDQSLRLVLSNPEYSHLISGFLLELLSPINILLKLQKKGKSWYCYFPETCIFNILQKVIYRYFFDYILIISFLQWFCRSG